MMELHVCNRSGSLLKAYALGDSPEVIVGRDETCDVRILARSVSREHCAIEQQGEALVLRDLGSTGGTFVQGDRIDAVPLADGMEVAVGPAVLKFFESGI
jgi:adenylate cyclase